MPECRHAVTDDVAFLGRLDLRRELVYLFRHVDMAFLSLRGGLLLLTLHKHLLRRVDPQCHRDVPGYGAVVVVDDDW